jgi:glycosyltransferase involved in cell wall biosynthesis
VTPPVSVVVPAFNRAAAIRPALESVLRQTWRDFELIVVDDGSTDGTPEAARALDDPRLRVIVTPRNMGAGAARNLGIAEARGAWIAFQDSDDEWLPLKLEKQMARLLAPGAGWIAAYCGMLILDAPPGRAGAGARTLPRYFPGQDGESSEDEAADRLLRWAAPWRRPPPPCALEGDLVTSLLRRSLISTQTLVARRDRLLEIGGFDPEFRAAIDRDCALRLAALGPIAFVDEPLALQRFSPNSITADRARKLPTRIRFAEKHAAALARHPAIHARHHYVIAGGHRAAGDLAAARAALARARALDPGEPRYWAMSARLALAALAPGRRRGAGG